MMKHYSRRIKTAARHLDVLAAMNAKRTAGFSGTGFYISPLCSDDDDAAKWWLLYL